MVIGVHVNVYCREVRYYYKSSNMLLSLFMRFIISLVINIF